MIEIVDEDRARKVLKLMDAIEELDDVQSVTANFEMQLDLMATAGD